MYSLINWHYATKTCIPVIKYITLKRVLDLKCRTTTQKYPFSFDKFSNFIQIYGNYVFTISMDINGNLKETVVIDLFFS
jgi:hypothetical protein